MQSPSVDSVRKMFQIPSELPLTDYFIPFLYLVSGNSPNLPGTFQREQVPLNLIRI